MRIDPIKNRVKGHESVEAHIQSVMDFVDGQVGEECKIQIVGMGDASDDVVKYLSTNWGMWKGRIEAVAIGMAYNWFEGERKGWSTDFAAFWASVSALLYPTPPFSRLLPFPSFSSLAPS